ncbi:MAG TPA: beta-ketoacyl-[acyl-carrier-protein] synthase family protein [Nitrococcus sp.]|nr:beta-ketoacyl-[acyl-carrier-protein] synthase family protein [Nitrococcus sp.]
MRRVAVTGIGIISPLGNDRRIFFDNLLAGRSGITAVSCEFDGKIYRYPAGRNDFEPSEHLPGIKRHALAALDRVTQMALAASAQSLEDAGLDCAAENGERIGVYLGTGMGGVTSLEESYLQLLRRDPQRLKPLTVPMIMNNAAAAHIASTYGLRGPNVTVSCACASSAVAIGEAYRQIRFGYSDVMLSGGAEALLTFGLFQAWSALRTLAELDAQDPSASCKPFDRNRSGLVLAEGAAIVVLEEWDRARARGAHIYGEIVGYGCTNDASHITRPCVEGQARAIALALAEAQLRPEDIDYINAHGTGTRANDVTETQAIKQVLGAAAARVPISSTKSMHGHLLGGAGALEFAAALLAMQYGAIPPTAHLCEPDPECDLDYVPNQARHDVRLRTVISNAFAFGGTNSVLVARACAA